MDDAHDAEPEHSPYLRLPWPLVAGGLAGVLVLALAAGLFANRYLRPQVSVVPTPIPAAAPPPAPTSVPAPTVAPTPTPAPAATPLVLATISPPTATAPPATMGPSSSAPPAALASPTASGTPAVDPLVADEVGKAYESFWRVQSQALLDLDTTHLAEVMDGDYLASVEQRIDGLRAENRAIKIHVSLSYSVVSTTAELASVVDDLEDNSVYVKIATEDPLTSPTADELRIKYQLKNFAGVWKVVDSVRYE